MAAVSGSTVTLTPVAAGTATVTVTAREVYDQVNACSCLTLILACIVYRQAREISRMAAAPDFPALRRDGPGAAPPPEDCPCHFS